MKDESLATLDAVKKRILHELKKISSGDDRMYEGYLRIGEALCAAKSQHLVPHRQIGEWCRTTFGLEKSQRCDIMIIYEEREKIEEARAWARSNGQKHSERMSISSSLRLLKLYKIKVAGVVPAPRRSRKPFKVLEQEYALLEEQNDALSKRVEAGSAKALELDHSAVANLHEEWGEDGTYSGTAFAAEVSLLRLAASKGISIQTLLNAHGLAVPEESVFAKKAGPIALAGGTPSDRRHQSEGIAGANSVCNDAVKSGIKEHEEA